MAMQLYAIILAVLALSLLVSGFKTYGRRFSSMIPLRMAKTMFDKIWDSHLVDDSVIMV